MKHLLAIIGSPRKGETLKAVKRFEEELGKLEEISVEYVMLQEVGLGDCTGCHNCITRGREFCRESEKLRELQDRMQAADGVILATPVYNQQVTALMKKFMDYYSFLWHRPELFGVKFMGISSGGGMFGGVFKYLKTNVESWGGSWTGGLGVPHYDSLTDRFREKADRDIRKKAAGFLKALEDRELPRPSIGRLMMFNIWKMNAGATRQEIPRDYEHWKEKGWLDAAYYYPTKPGAFKKMLTGLLTGIARGMMRKIYKGY